MCSENLQEAGENLLLNNLELSTKQEVGSKMWKLGHYPITESLRKQTGTYIHVGDHHAHSIRFKCIPSTN